MIGTGGGSFMAGSIVARLVLDKTGWDASMAAVRKQNEMLAAGAQQTGAALQSIGVKMAALGAVVVGAAALSVKAFSDFDAAMTESMAIMGDLSESTKNNLTKSAQEIARITTFSSTKAASAFYFLASAGMSAEESIKALPVVAKFAQAGMFDLEKATTLLADAQTSLGIRIRDDAVKNMEQMVRVSDVLSKANILSNASIEQLSEALTTRAGAALRLVGKDIEEGTAALAVFANAGVKGAEAGTRLDIVLRDLQTRAIKNVEAFKKYGVTVFDAEGEMVNLADIFKDLENAMAGMSDQQRRSMLMEMDFQDRSVASILALVGMSDELRRYEKELRKAGGTTEEIAKKQLQSLKSQVTLAKNEINLLAEAIGSTLAPLVAKLASGIKGVAKMFTDLTEGNKAVIGALALATVGLGALTLAAGTAVVGIGVFLTQWAVITATAPAVAAALANVGIVLAGFGTAILAVAVGFAAFKFGEWFFKITGVNKVVRAAASGVIWLGQQLGLARKPVDDLEASEERLARRHLFLATASAVAGRDVKNLLEAVKILKAEFAARGTVGDPGLDRWLATVTAAKPAVDRLKKSIEDLNAVFPGLGTKVAEIGKGLKEWAETLPGVSKWWDELGKKMEGLSPKAKALEEALKGIFEKYGVKSREDVTAELKNTRADLDLLRASASATPGAIEAVRAKIAELETQLYGVPTKLSDVTSALDELNKKWAEVLEGFGTPLEIEIPEIDADEMATTMNQALAHYAEQAKPAEVDIWELMGMASPQELVDKASEAAKGTYEKLKNDFIEPLKNAFNGLYNDIAMGLGDALQGMVEGTKKFAEAFKAIWDSIKKAFFRIIGEMVAGFLVKFVKKIIAGMGIIEAFTSALNIGGSIASGVASAGAGALAGAGAAGGASIFTTSGGFLVSIPAAEGIGAAGTGAAAGIISSWAIPVAFAAVWLGKVFGNLFGKSAADKWEDSYTAQMKKKYGADWFAVPRVISAGSLRGPASAHAVAGSRTKAGPDINITIHAFDGPGVERVVRDQVIPILRRAATAREYRIPMGSAGGV